MNNDRTRYAVPEDEGYEPESNNQVLKNLLGIKVQHDIEILEREELKRTETEILEIFTNDHKFTSEDITNIHELWLGDLYPFAGKYRTVNMSKNGFIFAPAIRIDYLMQKLNDLLAKYTPCKKFNETELIIALAIVHVELILIHPFREGNGRIARLVADLMAAQAKKPPLNYSPIDQTINKGGFSKYIEAIHLGLNSNYAPMEEIFKKLLLVS